MHKYHAKQTSLDGHKFDSIAESRRYAELKLLQQAGTITGLSVHPIFELQPKFTTKAGERIRAINYEADFTYHENGQQVVEDVKGMILATAKLKMKMFQYRYPKLQLIIIQ